MLTPLAFMKAKACKPAHPVSSASKPLVGDLDVTCGDASASLLGSPRSGQLDAVSAAAAVILINSRTARSPSGQDVTSTPSARPSHRVDIGAGGCVWRSSSQARCALAEPRTVPSQLQIWRTGRLRRDRRAPRVRMSSRIELRDMKMQLSASIAFERGDVLSRPTTAARSYAERRRISRHGGG